MSPQTLHEALAAMGYSHRPTGRGYRREVVDHEGTVVFVGTANETWAWLHELADIHRDAELVAELVAS